MSGGTVAVDAARLERAIERHADEVNHGETYDDFGQVNSCRRYCGPDIARRYADPSLMELTDSEEAAEEATWD